MINESKLNNRMLHLMENGFFGKQLLNEGALNISENTKVRIFQTFYNYYSAGATWILVDGIPGKNTANAINLLEKKDSWKDQFAKPLKDALSDYYKWILKQIKSSYLSDLKTLNNIHNLRMLQAILCLAGYTEVKPDGIMGPITKDAIKAKLGTDDITKVTDDNFKAVIDAAIANVEATNMSFKIEGVDAGTGGNAEEESGEEESGEEEAEVKNLDGQSPRDKELIKIQKLWRPVKITLNSGQKWYIAKAWIHFGGKKVSSIGWEVLDPNTKKEKNNDWNIYFPGEYASDLYIYGVAENGQVLASQDLELCYNPTENFAFMNAQQEGCTKRVMFANIPNPNAGFIINDSSVPPKAKESNKDRYKNWFNKPSDEDIENEFG